MGHLGNFLSVLIQKNFRGRETVSRCDISVLNLQTRFLTSVDFNYTEARTCTLQNKWIVFSHNTTKRRSGVKAIR